MARILIEAIQNGEETLAKSIIQDGSYGCIDSQTSKRDGTALFFCCSRGYLDLAKLLLERGACVTSTDKTQATPLHGAVDNGHLELVRLLLSYKADVNAQTSRGDTPLHLAAYRGFEEISRCLVEAGADCRLVNTFNFMPENEARTAGHIDLSNYLKAVQNERQPQETSEDTLDSLIKLDPPSDNLEEEPLPSQHHHEHQRHSQQLRHPQEHLEQYQQRQQQQQHCDGAAHRQSTFGQNDVMLRHKIPARDLSKYNNLSFIELDPPSGSFDGCSPPDQDKYFSPKRGGTGRSISEVQPKTHNVTLKIPNSVSRASLPVPNTISPLPHSVVSHAPRSASPHLLNPTLVYNFHNIQNNNGLRRPSTGSTGSCYSDISGGTGSDASSLMSSGSDASICYSDTRREDMEVPDYLQSLSQTYGVKYPPTEKSRVQRRVSTSSAPMESSEFSDIYDSSMFSFSSLISGPPSSLMSGCCSSINSMDSSASSGSGSKSCSNLYSQDASETKPQLSRAVSVHGAHPIINYRPKGRPDFNKSISAESRMRSALLSPQLQNIDHNGFCPTFNAMPSNDLSSASLSIPDKSRSSMTCVNIPLN